jgi:Leucine-rich repeat (LRR) protein
MPVGIFSAQTQLSVLSMFNNRLTELTAAITAPLINLQSLSLANNAISRIEAGVFSSGTLFNSTLGTITLDMSGNPSVCKWGWQISQQTTVVYCSCHS